MEESTTQWQAADGRLLSAPKGQREAGKEEHRSPLIDPQQTVAICPHYQQGSHHWVMYADTQASSSACSTAARLQLLFFSPVHTHVSVPNMSSLSALNQCLTQSREMPAMSFADTLGNGQRERLCFPHSAVMSTVSQWAGKTFSQAAAQFFPPNSARAEILYFLSRGKGSKHKPQMAEPRAELWRNPTELRVGELGGRKGRERGKRNRSGWKRGRKLRKDGPFVFTTRHTRWNAIHSALARNCYRLWCSLSKHIHFHTCS